MSIYLKRYRFHNPKRFGIMLRPLELLVKDDVFAGKQESGWKEIILIWLLPVVLFIESPLEFFQVFVQHVLSAKLIPASEMIDFHVRENAVFLKDPVHLLFLAPNDVPIIIPSLLPLSVTKPVINRIFKSSFVLYIGARSSKIYGGFG